jgi:hypothetical protein
MGISEQMRRLDALIELAERAQRRPAGELQIIDIYGGLPGQRLQILHNGVYYFAIAGETRQNFLARMLHYGLSGVVFCGGLPPLCWGPSEGNPGETIGVLVP